MTEQSFSSENESISVDTQFLVQQLIYFMPEIVLCMVGVVVSVIKYKQCPTPALLTIASCLLLAFVSVVSPLIRSYLIEQANNGPNGFEGVQRQMAIVSAISTLMRAVSFALLLAAVFAGRTRFVPPGHDAFRD